MADSNGPPSKYNVSFNASLTLPRHGGAVGDVPGIRFECSWNSAPDLSPSTIRRTLDGKGQSTGGGQLPHQQFRLRSTTLQQTPSSSSSVIEFTRPALISVRKNSSSGYGSGDASPAYLAATLTLTSGGSDGSPGDESVTGDKPIHHVPQAYDRRCRSTCSITLQNENHRTSQSGSGASGGVGDGCNFPLKPRRSSEGEAWDSHTAVHRLIRAPVANEKCPGFGSDVKIEPATAKAATPAVPVSAATECGQKEKATRRVGSRNKQRSRSRPRTVHIDVYCTASESESDGDGARSDVESGDRSPDTDESNTSSVYTVVRTDQTRVRHTRKKSGLPKSLSPAHSSKSSAASKPLLSYRISARELADAIAERSQKGSGGSVDGSILTPLEEELFRDLNVTTDSSIVWPDSDASESSSRQHRHQQPQLMGSDSFECDDQSDTSKQCSFNDQCRMWRSPDQERRKKMLEQRKMQWRAAKAVESVTSGYDSLRGPSDSVNRRRSTARTLDPCPMHISKESSTSSCQQIIPQQLLNNEGLMAKLCRHPSSRCRSASDRISRHNSQRCPKYETENPPNRRVSVPMRSSNGHLLPPDYPFELNRLSMVLPETWSLCSPPGGEQVKNRSPSPIPVPRRSRQQLVTTALTSNDSLKFHDDQVYRTEHESRVDLFKKSLMAAVSSAPLAAAPTGVIYRGTLKKFGHHVGPSRNPSCSCSHCVDHFARVKSLYY